MYIDWQRIMVVLIMMFIAIGILFILPPFLVFFKVVFVLQIISTRRLHCIFESLGPPNEILITSQIQVAIALAITCNGYFWPKKIRQNQLFFLLTKHGTPSQTMAQAGVLLDRCIIILIINCGLLVLYERESVNAELVLRCKAIT